VEYPAGISERLRLAEVALCDGSRIAFPRNAVAAWRLGRKTPSAKEEHRPLGALPSNIA